MRVQVVLVANEHSSDGGVLAMAKFFGSLIGCQAARALAMSFAGAETHSVWGKSKSRTVWLRHHSYWLGTKSGVQKESRRPRSTEATSWEGLYQAKSVADDFDNDGVMMEYF